MKVKDKDFEVYIKEEEILKAVQRLALEIDENYMELDPLFVSILNGSFMFASDLMKHVDSPSQISFIKVASYEETQSSGVIRELIGLKEDLKGRHIVIVEDIVDTGNTIAWFLDYLKKSNAASIEIVTLLHKPEATEAPLTIKFKGFEIPNKFVVGYGLDYDGYGRNLRDIYQIKD